MVAKGLFIRLASGGGVLSAGLAPPKPAPNGGAAAATESVDVDSGGLIPSPLRLPGPAAVLAFGSIPSVPSPIPLAVAGESSEGCGETSGVTLLHPENNSAKQEAPSQACKDRNLVFEFISNAFSKIGLRTRCDALLRATRLRCSGRSWSLEEHLQ